MRWRDPIDGYLWSETPPRVARVKKGCACGWAHAPWDVVAVGRFRPEGATGYRAHNGTTLRATRAEAMTDICKEWMIR